MDLNRVDAGWKKSTFSNPDNCVEVGRHAGTTLVRDTKAGGAGHVLAFDADAWSGFLAGIRGGEFS